jgi:hypothetical protein
VEAHTILAPEQTIAIHHGTFPLADEPQHEPRERVQKLATELGVKFLILRNGEYFSG